MAEMKSETTVQLRVRYAECDPQAVVHHARYPVWLELARTELLRESGFTYKNLEEQGFMLVVAKMELSYKRPAQYDDLLDITVRTAKVTGAKIIHEYEIRRDGLLLVTASTTLGCVGTDGRIKRMPDLFTEAHADS